MTVNLTIYIIAVNFTFGQISGKEPDSRVFNIQESLLDSTRANPEKYLPILTKTLLYNVTNEFEKVKIIHDWIATEITYDNEIYLRISDLVYKTNDVLTKKKAICIGYCNLLSKMCNYAGIENVSIIGYAKANTDNEESLPDNYTKPNHQWSAVKIYGKWYLIDVTWDAGYLLDDSFIFKYSTTYLFIDPEAFIKNHFPEDIIWQLLNKPVSWHEFREMKFTEPVNKLALNTMSIKGGISFSRLYNFNIPGISESKGFNFSLSLNKGITNELGMEMELSYDHMNINQDLNFLQSSPYFNIEKSTYSDPVNNGRLKVGSLGFEKIGAGINFKYHLQNETNLLPFLKTGFSVSLPFSLASSEKGIAVNDEGSIDVLEVNNLGVFDQVLYGAILSLGTDFVRRDDSKKNYLPVFGIELKWSLMLNSLNLFKDYDEGENEFKSYSINLMFYL